MVRKLISSLLSNKTSLLLMLKLHSLSYSLAGSIACKLNGGIHPKHRIMQYKEWFVQNIKSDWVVLDVGCNTGMMPERISQKATYVYGIEINPAMIKEAKKNRQRKNIEYICADATIFDYAPLKPVNCVSLSNVLEHIEHREDFLKKLIEQVKWKDKIRFLIRVPMIDREWIAVYKKEMGIEWRLDPTHFTEYTFEQLGDELSKAGLRIINHHVKWGELYAECEAIGEGTT